jgi:hypothetical protein
MQVAFKIEVDGKQDITKLIADRLLSLEIIDRAGVKSDRLTIEIDDRDQRLEIPRTGAKLAVWLGYVGEDLVKVGQFAVDGVDLAGPTRTMTIGANAVDMNGSIKAPKERSFDEYTLGDLASVIAADNGLKLSISDKLGKKKLGHVDQTESDMQLLTREATKYGATVKVADGRLVVADRASGKANSGKALPKIEIRSSDCASWSASVIERTNYKSVRAYYQDLDKAERVGVTAGSGKPELVLKNSYSSPEEAQEAANNKLASIGRGQSTVQVSGMVGNPSLAAECIADLIDFRAGVDGDNWVVNQVTHRVSRNGYTNDVELEQKDKK